MQKNSMTIIIVALLAAFLTSPVFADNKPIIKSTVVDAAGKPVQGAYIFFYDSEDTRRAVDLVSPVTDAKGFCQKAIPPGKYWVLARLKESASFDMGPLMIGDKVSGDPLELDVADGDNLDLKFTVIDLLENITMKSKKREDLNLVSGRIVDEQGEGVAHAYAYANRHNRVTLMAGYFSAWTEDDGRFQIYLPKGKYYLGAKKTFGPKEKYTASQEINVDSNMENSDIVFSEQ